MIFRKKPQLVRPQRKRIIWMALPVVGAVLGALFALLVAFQAGRSMLDPETIGQMMGSALAGFFYVGLLVLLGALVRAVFSKLFSLFR